jgi:hypothetical protein
VPANVDGAVPEQRVAECVPLLPEGGAVTGWASLLMQGAGFLDGVAADGQTRRPVLLVVGPGHSRRSRPGVRYLQDRVGEVVWIRGIPCTPVRRALFDEMRLQPCVREAVVAMDMTAAAELVSIRRMESFTLSHPGWDGVPQVREALGLAHEGSVSPPETRMRLVWVLDAGLRTPLVNQPVFDRTGRLLGYPDLLDVEAGLVGEYDGDDHRRARRHSKDVDREALFRSHLLEVTRATSYDVRDRPRLAARVVEARRRARFLPPAARRWTLRPPAGWRPQPTLDELLDRRGEPE